MCDVKVFAEDLEPTAMNQIEDIQRHAAFEGVKIRIMPDAHAGAGCVIGFTADLGDKVVPNLVGVDIGCGMYSRPLARGLSPDGVENEFGNSLYSMVDWAIRRTVPSGFDIHGEYVYYAQPAWDTYLKEHLLCYGELVRQNRFPLSLGTLGGGNHFIELEQASDGQLIMVIHSGSRNLGNQVASHYQKIANSQSLLPSDLDYLDGQQAENYLHDMKIAQGFARANRETIADLIDVALSTRHNIGIFDTLSYEEDFHTVHNYIGDDNIVRKGAVSALQGERCVIPMNMAYGSLFCVGKGNEDWNYSAPHGAGRLMGRREAKRTLDTGVFENVMQDSGVWSTSVCADTVDESPMVYKSPKDIQRLIGDTVEVVDVWKSVYNYKAG